MTSPRGTITALLTPTAPGAIAVVGLAGPDVDDLLKQVLQHPKADRSISLPQDRPVFCRLMDEGKPLDDVVVVRSEYAGLPIAEVNTHGGVRIAQRTLAMFERLGARVIAGIEFHEQTTQGNPVEREIDRALIKAQGRRLVRWLLTQRDILPPYLENRDGQTADETAAFVQRAQAAIRLIRGIRIALIGPANAGKSTLANQLIGRDEIITSDTAGTTRDWVAQTAFIRGWPVTLTDTAGLRETACHIESEAIRRSHEQAQQADLCVIVLDGSQGRGACDAGMRTARQLVPGDRPIVVAINKWDHPQTAQSDFDGPFDGDSADEPPPPTCRISALQGEGMDRLETLITDQLGLDRLDDERPTGFLPHHLPPESEHRADSGPAHG